LNPVLDGCFYVLGPRKLLGNKRGDAEIHFAAEGKKSLVGW